MSIEDKFYRYLPLPLRKLWDRIKTSSIGYRLAHGTFWSMVGAGASQSMLLLTSVVVARLLGRQQFGQFGIINNTVGMFSVFAGFGLGMTATKYMAEYRSKDPDKAGRIAALSSLFAACTGGAASLVLLAAAGWLASETLADPSLERLLRIASGFPLFAAISGAQIGTLAGLEAFRKIARLNIAAGILSFPMLAGGGYLFGLEGVVTGLVASTAATCLLNTLVLRRTMKGAGISPGFSGCLRERSVLTRFSVPAALSGILVNPVNWLCAAMLVNQPGGYAAMGIYSAAGSWQKAILFLPGCLNAIALPMLSGFHGARESGNYRKALKYNILLNAGSALAAAVVVSVSSGLIMRSYGPGFVEGSSVLIILSLATVLAAVNSVAGSAIASTGRTWAGLVFNLMWGIALLSGARLLIPGHGAAGLALATLISYILHSLWQVLYLRRLCRVTLA